MNNSDKNIKVENNFSDNEKIYELYDFFSRLNYKESEIGEQIKSDIRLSFSVFQKPIKYKELFLYPITMQYYEFAQILFSCLVQRKNSSGDIKAISMSYFDYLFYLAEKGEIQYIEFLLQLLLIILKKERYAKTNGEFIMINNRPLENIVFFASENKKNKFGVLKQNIDLSKEFSFENYYDIYNSSDFNKIRDIICEQNDIELPDETLSKEVLEEIEQAEKFLYKDIRETMGTLEDKINSLIVVGNVSRNEIMNMSIKNFNNCLERISMYINYNLSTILAPNMDKKARDKMSKECSTWLAKRKKISRYDRVKIDLDTFKQKLSADN